MLSPPELSSFHANIVKRFCLTQNVEGRHTTERKDKFEITDPAWTIIGGGKWTINEVARTMRNDFTIAHNNRIYQIEKGVRSKEVMVEERINGSHAHNP